MQTKMTTIDLNQFFHFLESFRFRTIAGGSLDMIPADMLLSRWCWIIIVLDVKRVEVPVQSRSGVVDYERCTGLGAVLLL
jgi:hypothetical protein